METPKILYIEDNHLNIRLIQRSLKTTGYKLIVAHDGDEGIMLAHLEKPDIILLDLNLPVIDGLSVLKILKQDPQFEKCPIIILSAEDTMPKQMRARELGADAWLNKPISRSQLLRTLQMFTPSFA